jgi:hypothetical protein
MCITKFSILNKLFGVIEILYSAKELFAVKSQSEKLDPITSKLKSLFFKIPSMMTIAHLLGIVWATSPTVNH